MNADGVGLLSAWSAGLAGLVYSACALKLLQLRYLHRPRELSKTALFSATALTAMWGWSCLFLLDANQSPFAVLTPLLDMLRYGSWFAFLLSLLRTNPSRTTPSSLAWMTPVAVLLIGFALLAHVLAGLGVYATRTGYRLSLLGSMAAPVFGMVLLEQVFRNISKDSRWNVKPLSLGLSGAFLFDLYLFSQAALFSRIDADAQSIRGTVHALMAPLLVLSMTRRSEWISAIRLSPKAAFHSATLLISGLYLLFVAGAGYYIRYFGGAWGRALQLGLVLMALVALMALLLSDPLRAKLRVQLGKHFFRHRFDYREEWLKFTAALSSKNSGQETGEQVIRGLADMLESPAGGLWMKTKDESGFHQVARWNLAQTQEVEAADSPLCQFIRTSGWVINLEEYRSYARRYGSLKLPPWLQSLAQAWLVVPLLVGDELIGFVVLASARTPLEVNWEVNDLLKTAGQQAASFLAQMQATEALLEVRKFDAFNRMSAFVVHDLKNVVTQLSLMMKNAKRHGANPVFQQDMLLTVENALEKMRQLMLQLREGATPQGTALGVNLAKIVQRIKTVAAGRGRTLELQLSETVATRGSEDRLERIIGHIVQNAFDATAIDGRVWLTLDQVDGHVKVVIGDTGLGMSQDFLRNRLFKPFQTTKRAGMGIGAYESYQYVRELGGHIDVQSTPGVGTTVAIYLPLLGEKSESAPRELLAA